MEGRRREGRGADEKRKREGEAEWKGRVNGVWEERPVIDHFHLLTLAAYAVQDLCNGPMSVRPSVRRRLYIPSIDSSSDVRLVCC